MSGGSSTHFSNASGQRVRNRQPLGIAEASGVSPTRIVRFARSPGAGGSGDGATDTSAAVYGWRGVEMTAFAGPISMILPEVHDRDAVGDHPRERQVVGDEQVRQVALGPQVEHQPQQLRPDRDVEHADGLVGDDQLRPEHEGAGDDDALALAAGQLVRVARRERLRRSEPRRLERVEHALASLVGLAREAVDDQRLGDEVEDRLLRVQRLVRVLEDHPDPASGSAADRPGEQS